MANEGIFDELNINPLIVSEDDGKVEEPVIQEIEEQEDTEKGKKKVVAPVKKEPELLEVDEETDDETPLKDQETDDNGSNNDQAGLNQWIKFYKEKGLIDETLKDEEVTSFDTLLEKLQEQQLSTATMLVDSFKESLPKEIKDLIETWEDGAEGESFKRALGVKAELVEADKLEPETIKGNVDLQKNIVKNYLKKTTNFNDDKIKKLVDRLEVTEELETEAIENATELKALLITEEKTIREQAKTKEQARIKAAQEQRTELVNYIKDTKAIIPDINLTEGEKREIENLIFNPVGKDQYGNPVFYFQKLFNDNPKEMAVKMNYLAVATKGFTDWTKLYKKAETRVNKKVESLLDTPPPKVNTKTGKAVESDDWKRNLQQLNKTLK